MFVETAFKPDAPNCDLHSPSIFGCFKRLTVYTVGENFNRSIPNTDDRIPPFLMIRQVFLEIIWHLGRKPTLGRIKSTFFGSIVFPIQNFILFDTDSIDHNILSWISFMSRFWFRVCLF